MKKIALYLLIASGVATLSLSCMLLSPHPHLLS